MKRVTSSNEMANHSVLFPLGLFCLTESKLRCSSLSILRSSAVVFAPISKMASYFFSRSMPGASLVGVHPMDRINS